MAASSLIKFKFPLFQSIFTCHECKENIFKTGDICKDSADHYMRYTYGVHSCPVCSLMLPTTCAIAAHLRMHLKVPPYICPQCGITLPETIISYPFKHNCEGFNMMRASIKFKCNLENCNNLVHPEQFKEHFQTHLAKVYECTLCSLIWSNKTITRCGHYNDVDIIQSIGFQCQLCSNNLIAETNMENHVNKHYDELCHHWNVEIYPCKICHIIHTDVRSLLDHHVIQHNAINIKNIMENLLDSERQLNYQHNTAHFRQIKTCNMCLMSYASQITNEYMNILQNACPNGCLEYNEPLIQCCLCKMKINQRWVNIKIHYAQFHKDYKCLDLQVRLTRIDMSLYYTKLESITPITGNTHTGSEEAHAKVRKSLQTAENQIKKIKIKENESVVSNDGERKFIIKEDNESVQKSENVNGTKMNMVAKVNNDNNETQISKEDNNLIGVPLVKNDESEQSAENRGGCKNRENETQANTEEDDLTKAGSSGEKEKNEPKQVAEYQHICNICNHVCDTKENLESHLITHREPHLPYQCLECGECFAARASFSIHLLIGHEIRKVQEYINTKPCYNEAARYRLSNSVFPSTEVKENQCEVCQQQLENAFELGRHVRTHGLAFVLSLKRKRQIDPNLM